MKKRLLSAVLALAMVLTLLPVSAFATSSVTVTPGTGWSLLDDLSSSDTASYSVTYHTAKSTDRYGNVFDTAGWYYINTSTKEIRLAPGGVVTNMNAWTDGASGTWWANPDVATQHNNTSFKLNANASISGHSSKSMWDSVRSLTVDLNGYTLTWSVTEVNNMTKVELKNTAATAGTLSGDISVGTAALGQGKNFTLSLDNVTSSSKLTLNHAGSGLVTITNSTFGSINLVGVPAANGTTTTGGSVTVTGSKSNVGAIKLDKMGTGYTISGGRINVNGGARAGGLSVNSTNGADIDVTNATSGGVTIQGYASTLDVTSGKVGAVKVFGHDSTLAANLKNSKAPTVTITGNGAEATSIEKVSSSAEALLQAYNINVLYNAKVTGTITLDHANITVNGGSVGGDTSLKIGKLTLGAANQTTMPTTMAAIKLGAVDVVYDGGTQTYGEVAMTVPGTNVTTGAISEVANNVMNISVTIPADYNNKFTSITPAIGAAKWAKGTISGGKWTTALTYSYGLLNSNLLYHLTDARDTGFTHSYWQSKQINDLVAKYVGKTTTVETVDIDSGKGKLTLQVGDPATVPNPGTGSGGTLPTGTAKTVFEVSFGPNATTFQLPSVVGGNSVKEWTATSRTPVPGGGSIALAGTDAVTFTADSLGYQITKVNDVEIADRQANPTATATLSGNTINLSGAVWAVGNTATIDLKIKTDAKDIQVQVAWNPETNALTFMEGTPTLSSETNGSMIFTDGMTAIQLTVNNTKYTLKNAGLRKEASLLTVQGNTGTSLGGMTTTVNIADSIMNKTAREQLAKDLTALAGANGVVDFSASPAVLERLGAVLAGIDNKQAESWLRTARQQAYRKQHNNQNPTQEPQLLTTGYNTVAAVLYMNVNITSFGNQATGGMLTATMTPYLRVEVQHDSGAGDEDNPPIIVRQPASLGRLTGEVGQVKITLPTVSTGFTPAGFAAQNNTYVYPVAQNATSKAYEFTLTHAASSGDGFGTIVINGIPAPISMKDDNDTDIDPVVGYNTLQAAVDDAKNGYVVKVGPAMTGTQSIEMRGTARTIYIDTDGNAVIKCATNGVIVAEKVNGHNYSVQLTRDNIVKPTEKSVTISTVAAANGSAGLSASKADPGETITVTTSPKAGYGTSGLTIRTNTGATVAYTSTATNRYTFKVPEGVTSITVTPAFAVNGDVAINVASAANGSASTNASGGKVKGGTTVTVTTRPNSGYTTLAVSAVTNTGSSVSVSRVAENTYTFVAPVNATSVTVTPSFTASAHPFIDVAPSHWANNAVGFVYRHGLMKGAGSSVIFAGTTNISRADLVLILYRLSGEPYASTYSSFNDVAPTAYYAAAVNWANANGIVTGGTGNNFYPKLDISRQDLASILYRYNNYRRGSSSGSSSLAGFVDSGLVSPYALAPMQWAVGNGVVNGSGNSLMPRGTASRYEAAQMLMNYCQRFLNMR